MQGCSDAPINRLIGLSAFQLKQFYIGIGFSLADNSYSFITILEYLNLTI